MRKRIMGIVLGTAAAAVISGTAWAGMIMGELVKVDASFYIVKDDKGKEAKIHFDGTTQKTGDLKPGAKVEVDEANGHAKSIKVMAEKK